MMDRIVAELTRLPGVEAVGHSRMMPLQGASFRYRTQVPGAGDEVHAQLSATDWDIVSPAYFRAVGLPILEGRGLAADDRDGRSLVAVVNQTFARIAWPDRPAVGQQIQQLRAGGEDVRPIRVVGVVKDARTRRVGEPPRPFVYVPFAQHPEPTVELFVKHAQGHDVAGDVRRIISSVEPLLPVVRMQSFEEAIGLELFPQRVAAWAAGAVGLIGMFLAALGLYGLAAFLVAQRAREIAIRIALGASRREVRAIVLGQAAKLGAIGIASGILLAWGLGRVVQSLNLLVDVRPFDPVTVFGVSAVMIAVLLGATYLPARRAAATDSSAALRAE
jgi:predicted permease